MVNTVENLTLGVDIGKTKVGVGVVDVEARKLVKAFTEQLDVTDKSHILYLTNTLINKALLHYSVSGIGIGSFGIIDSVNGVVMSNGVVKDWSNVPLVKMVKEEFGINNVVLENDAVAAVAGEYVYDGRGKDIAVITVGTSIGVGTVIDGKVFRGAHNLSGQIAYLDIFDKHTVAEICGGQGMVDRMRQKYGIMLSTKEIVDAAHGGDSRAFEIVNDAVNGLAYIARVIGKLLDPDLILFCGSIPVINDYFYSLLMDRCRQYGEQFGKIEIGRAKLGINSGIFGGAILCKKIIA